MNDWYCRASNCVHVLVVGGTHVHALTLSEAQGQLIAVRPCLDVVEITLCAGALGRSRGRAD